MQIFPHGGNLFGTKRRTVAFAGTGFVRRAETDFGLAGNQGRTEGFVRFANSLVNLGIIMTVNGNRIPAVGFKAGNLIG